MYASAVVIVVAVVEVAETAPLTPSAEIPARMSVLVVIAVCPTRDTAVAVKPRAVVVAARRSAVALAVRETV